MTLNDPYRTAAAQCADQLVGQANRAEPDLATVRERLNDLLGRQDCEIGNINNLLNGLKDMLGVPGNPRDPKADAPAPMFGLDVVSERLMKQQAERDILLSELAGLIQRRKG